MEFVRNIEGVCSMDGREPFKCTGSIKVVNQAGKSIYASWSMQDENGQMMAGSHHHALSALT